MQDSTGSQQLLAAQDHIRTLTALLTNTTQQLARQGAHVKATASRDHNTEALVTQLRSRETALLAAQQGHETTIQTLTTTIATLRTQIKDLQDQVDAAAQKASPIVAAETTTLAAVTSADDADTQAGATSDTQGTPTEADEGGETSLPDDTTVPATTGHDDESVQGECHTCGQPLPYSHLLQHGCQKTKRRRLAGVHEKYNTYCQGVTTTCQNVPVVFLST